jgi:beta-lactamase regulating signal transducer with metallopeptidase domain/uncharacterized GH25 family protein
MNADSEWKKYLDWLLSHSLQAGVLVLLVLLMQWVFRRQLTNRWRFALWWIVLARLLLPFSPASTISLFNVFKTNVHLENPGTLVFVPFAQSPENKSVRMPPPAVELAQMELPPIKNIPPMEPVLDAPDPPNPIKAVPSVSVPADNSQLLLLRPLAFDNYFIVGAAAIWLAGVLGLAGVVAIQLLGFYQKLDKASAPGDPSLQILLNECRVEFGNSGPIQLLETDAVQSPALFGLVRLRLLLPRRFGEQFNRRELRYIFLHEIAHVKRGDLWLSWLVTALQILHWFNPLLWLGFARLRADRELACDELALLRAGDDAGTAYGETVVKLLEHLSSGNTVPGLVGILEDKKQMRRRISMISHFRKPSRWSVLAAILVAAMAAAALTDAQSSKPVNPADTLSTNEELIHSIAPLDLTGAVSAKDGTPLAVPAMVFIDTAAPKTGTSTFCPSCYADCKKHSRTDAQGNFTIASLDPQLTFRILAVAKGYKPASVSKVDPAHGPLNVKLEPIESADAAPDRSLRGRVVNPKGQPIEGAVVDMVGIETKDGGGRWGTLDGIDSLAVTDENGEFLITAKKPFEMMDVKVSARTFADKPFQKLPSGQTNELVMTEGAALTGRVLNDGKPLVGITVGVSAVDRSAGNYLGHFEINTGEGGKFTFVNLPPDADFQLYTLMGTMKQSGAVPVRQIHTDKDGETIGAGDLVAGPAYRLAGRVVLADGEPLPPKVRLLVSRDKAWDSMQITLDAAGNFDTAGIPPEMISLSARVKGYHVSARNLSADQMNPFQLIGRVDHDITNLVFMLEKGPDLQPDYRHIDPEYNEIRQHSLRGAEGVLDHSRDWTVCGHVLDSATKEPVQHFRVTPGQTDNFGQTGWNTLRAVDGSNGVYLVYISKRTAQPMMKAEADGYLPTGLELQPGDATNIDFILEKGGGPAGTVVTPDAQPEAGATLVLLDNEQNHASFNSEGGLTAFGDRSAMLKADANGHFSFKPILGMKAVAAASSNGFVVVSLESLATNSMITLEPFGRITGTLKRTSGPGTNETLDVRFTGDNSPQIGLWIPTDTDAKGHFEFKAVPSGHLQISYRQRMQHSQGWMNPSLQEVEVKPGQTLHVNITAPDREPETDMSPYQPPQAKLVPGVRAQGVVLLPNGKPAVDADVALQVPNQYLAISKGTFSAGDAREKGLIASAGQDGSFSLPIYEGAESVIALNEEGYAQISIDQLKASPKITLQPWGRIEGTLQSGHHPRTNEIVVLEGPPPRWITRTFLKTRKQLHDLTVTNSQPTMLKPPTYDSNAFRAKTDDHGRFTITFVPPGQQIIARMVPSGGNSWTYSELASLEVKPGEIIVTNLGGMGRTVIGKVRFADSAAPDLKNGMVYVNTPMSKILQKIKELRTDEERRAFYLSEEFQVATKDARHYSAFVQSDGSFRAEDVLPGKYEVIFQKRMVAANTTSITIFTSPQKLTVPPAKDKDDDSSVDWGDVALKQYQMPILKPTAGAN